MRIPIFHSYGKWYLSGVNTWTVNLIRAMKDSQFDSKVLFTGIPRQPQPELDELEIPYDFLNVPAPRKRRQEWKALKEYLEAHAPCIYITNFDFYRSCAVGTFSPHVRVVSVIHSDEECYFDELSRIGRSCNAIVCVSSYLTAKTKEQLPHLADRVHFIPYGIPISTEPVPPRPANGPLRLCYCNRLQQYQKRVFDLPIIAAELERRGVDYELDIAGDGPDAEELRNRFAAANLKSLVNFHGRIPNATVMNLCRRSHIFLLTSDFEGLPISLLEAMSVGCVPVVYQIDSGITDAIPSNCHGMQVDHGDRSRFAEIIKELDQNRGKLVSMANNSITFMAKHFSIRQMANHYDRLFSALTEPGSSIAYVRNNSVNVPKELTVTYRLMRRVERALAKIRVQILLYK